LAGFRNLGVVDLHDVQACREQTLRYSRHYIGNWTDLPAVNRTALSGLFTVNT
jgi:hypothetical protein